MTGSAKQSRILRHPRGGDCFVALRAPRNDNLNHRLLEFEADAAQAFQRRAAVFVFDLTPEARRIRDRIDLLVGLRDVVRLQILLVVALQIVEARDAALHLFGSERLIGHGMPRNSATKEQAPKRRTFSTKEPHCASLPAPMSRL
jgi:hypothetical protein